MSEKLKLCPHCKGEANVYKNSRIFLHQEYHGYPKHHNHGFRVECEGECHSMTCWWHTEQQAIKAWNMRVKE